MNIQLTDDEKIKVLNGNDLYSIMQKILLREERIDQDREHFWVVGLANNNRILFIELISLGTVNATIAEPMEVFSLALQKRSVRMILVHNHPSGELMPSEADKDHTDRLIQVGKIVNLEVYDHLIITTNSYLSFNDTGLMDQLKLSTKYVPQYQLEEQYKKQAELLSDKKLVLRESEIAIKFLEIGVDINVISEATGLSVEEIRSLERGE
jgi:DNA repair protein RadC